MRTNGHHAVVRGVPRLSGAPVRAHDIRAGAAMVVAGLAAEGETVISGVGHIDRGYDDLVGRLGAVGADIAADSSTPSRPASGRRPLGRVRVTRRRASASRPTTTAMGARTSRISSQPPWWASTARECRPRRRR